MIGLATFNSFDILAFFDIRCLNLASDWPHALQTFYLELYDNINSARSLQIYCTFSMGQQSKVYKMSDFQENSRPISDPYFYHCNIMSIGSSPYILYFICYINLLEENLYQSFS